MCGKALSLPLSKSIVSVRMLYHMINNCFSVYMFTLSGLQNMSVSVILKIIRELHRNILVAVGKYVSQILIMRHPSPRGIYIYVSPLKNIGQHIIRSSIVRM